MSLFKTHNSIYMLNKFNTGIMIYRFKCDCILTSKVCYAAVKYYEHMYLVMNLS